MINLYKNTAEVVELSKFIASNSKTLAITGLNGSALSVLFAAANVLSCNHLFVFNDKEKAEYFHNDLLKLFGESDFDFEKRQILFFPELKKNSEREDNTNNLLRSEILHRLENFPNRYNVIISFEEAISEKVIAKSLVKQHSLKLQQGETIDYQAFIDNLIHFNFEFSDFVVEPGQYSVRGGIIDVFSFNNDFPFRIEFFGNKIDSIRTFNPVNQLSIEKFSEISIMPNLLKIENSEEEEVSFFEYLDKEKNIIWKEDGYFCKLQQKNINEVNSTKTFKCIYFTASQKEVQLRGNDDKVFSISCDFVPQPVFNKNFNLLIDDLAKHSEENYQNFIISDNPKQLQRLDRIIFETASKERPILYKTVELSLHEGFIDKKNKICCYTDHQIFERFHRFKANSHRQNRESISIQELYDLKPGDYVTHIDHGVGRFIGLETTSIGGKIQDTIKIAYKDDDILYVSIHSLHKVSKYTGKEGSEPTLYRLSSHHWSATKSRAKQRIKDIAKDLIKLYAQRKASKGFAFSEDSYLQNELEANFLYEDTPDQYKATQDVKHDMELPIPMDRLICGDVGFGKTEVAIRAAFKAVADGKQAAVLVPTTILAFQHYHTFSERLADMPCTVDYISRFRSAKEQKELLKKLAEGKIDILIGTHRLIGKDIIFKDLGLLIVDEEQKFGVSVKEKLKQLKVNVDTLTLTATPIPRTLQFSLMGARDMSLITTQPPNRYPIQTEVIGFDENKIREIILNELQRGGQVFFVHSRVQNIMDIAAIVKRLVPDAKIGIGHGQMDGDELEEVMLDFINGSTDILIATKIVENGLDIPNANTIIINEAQMYGLSELHQLRGRVGRSNKKAYCYLIAPANYLLSDDAKKRLRVVEEFSDLGSGFNIAMRDLDIRGAGNILGGEQSGFVSDIGYETYNQILEEAINELKYNEFKDVFADEQNNTIDETIAKDCTLDTDIELRIPEFYVQNITERYKLYKELDSLKTDDELLNFKKKLTDRFGKLPEQTENLVMAVKMRRLAQYWGFEKVIWRQNVFVGIFIADQQSLFYQSYKFEKILSFATAHTNQVSLQESNDKLRLKVLDVKSLTEVITLLKNI
ncbi:MAG: transcription-repair coupling factor [Bacteroidales bacterium]|nr:transcription-repair coupling factor [Bacteroidales bacterium]